MTPPASWRPNPGHWLSGGFIIGPAICKACGQPVWFGRSSTHVQGVAVLGEVRAWREWGRYAVHRCIAREVGWSAA